MQGVMTIRPSANLDPAAENVPPSARITPGEDTRERLRQIALDLFWEKGYRSTSTRDLAAALGVKQASLYYHVKNKEELLYDICYSSLLQVIHQVEAAAADADNPLEALRQIARSHLTATLTLQKQFLISMYDYRSLSVNRNMEINLFWRRYEDFVSSIFNAAGSGGLMRSDVPNKYHYHLLMSMTTWPVLWFHPERELTIAQLADIFAGIYMEGAARPGHRFIIDARASEYVPAISSAASFCETRNETHARLLETASMLFASRGYSTTSIREIAEAMGIEKASLYYYVVGKEDLCYQICKAAHEHLIGGVRAALQQTQGAEARLYALITAHVVCLLQNQHWHATANEQIDALAPKMRQEIVALRDGYEAMVRQILSDAQQAGVLRSDISAKYLGLALIGMITHIYPWYEPGVDIAPFALGQLLADVFVNGIAKRG
jgi:AcrR family transcriptional regulator